MEYKIHSFRHAEVIFENDSLYTADWQVLKSVLDGISDADIIEKYEASPRESQKSISDAINILINNRLVACGWTPQSAIFNESEYRPNSYGHWWTLDFSKGEFSVEVAFNHGEATAWNLIKPVLASELNHVDKAAQTSAGIIITATDTMKRLGNFDGAAGSYEKFLQYLRPLNNILTVPMVIIGLKSPDSFFIDPKTKQVTDIVHHVFPQSWIGNEICRILDSKNITYQKSSSITRNGNRIPMYIKSTGKKIAVLTQTPDDTTQTILHDENWYVICVDQIHSERDFDRVCDELRQVQMVL